MDIGTLSFRYAKALFSLAKDKGLEEQVYENMKMLSDSFLRERSLQEALVNPLVSTAAKEKLLVTAGGIKVPVSSLRLPYRRISLSKST